MLVGGGGIKIDLHNLKGDLVELSEQQVISNIFLSCPGTLGFDSE